MKLIVPLFFVLWVCSSCEGDYSIAYNITGLDLSHAENTGEVPIESTLDSIPGIAYAIRLHLYPVELSRSGRYLDRETPPSNSNPPDSVHVICNKDFNTSYLKGSLLDELFLVYNHSYFNVRTLDNVYFTNQYYEGYYDQPLPEFADLLLVESPDISQEFKFYVTLYLRDGTVFMDSTTNVHLY